MKRLMVGLIALILFAACASVPAPKGELEKADLALRNAEAAQGTQFAPLETRMASDKLADARAAMADGRHLEARRLSEEAKLDAVLAETKSKTALRVRVANELQADIDAIREEAQRAGRILRERQ